ARQQLTMRIGCPRLLVRMWPHVSVCGSLGDHALRWDSGVQRYRAIDRDHTA
ncbi:hypothetical protein KI387_006129, partial [Taxus chinensis]